MKNLLLRPFALALLAACEPLVDANYHGEPMLTLSGEIHLDPAMGQHGADWSARPTGPLRLALLWAEVSGGPDTSVATVEQQAMTTAELPAHFTLTLFIPPDASLLAPEPDGTGQYALGLTVVYVDGDGDGRWSQARDTLVGGALGHAVVYTPKGTDGAWLGKLTPGYHHVRRATPDCQPGGRVPLAAAHSETVDLTVAPTMPLGVLLDLDCDGSTQEWAKACPAPSHLASMCAQMPAEGWPCGVCPR